MKKYLYETHCHTNVSSRCSRFSPEEIVKLYTTLKYDGVFITDHCFLRTLNDARESNGRL